jgi:hypothetical protein
MHGIQAELLGALLPIMSEDINWSKYWSPQGFVVAMLGIAVALAVFDQYLFRYFEVVDSGVSWRVMDLALLLVFFGFAVQWAVNDNMPRWQSAEVRPVVWALFYFLVVGVVAIVRGYITNGTYALGVSRYTLAGGFLLLPALVFSNLHLRSLTSLFRVAVVIMICGWMVRFVPDLPAVIRALPGRYYSQVESYSAFAYAVVTMVMITVVAAPAFSADVKKSARVLLGSIALVSCAFLFLSQHRSVWFASSVGVVSLGWSAYRLSRREGRTSRFFAFGLGALLIFGIFAVVYGPIIKEIIEGRLVFLTEGYEADSTGNWRVAGWMHVITRTLEGNPIFGSGFVKPEMWRAPNGSLIQVWVHNEYVHYFGVSGFAGFIGYVMLITASVLVVNRLEMQASRETRLLVIAVKAMILMSAAYMVFYNQSIIFWFSIGLLIVADQLILKERHFVQSIAQAGLDDMILEEDWIS